MKEQANHVPVTSVKIGDIVNMTLINGTSLIGYVDQIDCMRGYISFVNFGQIRRYSKLYKPTATIDVLESRMS